MSNMYRTMAMEKSDNIRISRPYYSNDLEHTADDIKQQYAERGETSFEEVCKEYYKEISIVDSETLQRVKIIHKDE